MCENAFIAFEKSALNFYKIFHDQDRKLGGNS